MVTTHSRAGKRTDRAGFSNVVMDRLVKSHTVGAPQIVSAAADMKVLMNVVSTERIGPATPTTAGRAGTGSGDTARAGHRDVSFISTVKVFQRITRWPPYMPAPHPINRAGQYTTLADVTLL